MTKNIPSQAERVHALMAASLYEDDELELNTDGSGYAIPPDALRVEGIVRTFILNPARIKENETAILGLIAEIVPDIFFEGKGGGMTFLDLCMNRDGEHWAEHPTMESLVVLGVAVDAASFVMPREMWSMFPGGMPYVTFKEVAAA